MAPTAKMSENCSLCGHAVHVVTESAPGYQEGPKYTIYECEGCFSSFASPLAVEDAIYGHIYDNIQHVPGYNRYYHYAHEVLNQKRALDYLSRQEESYWAVARHLRERRNAEGRLTILEVGCGMGYFTYALSQDGFSVTGVDISPQAVAWALENYGPYYANKTLEELKAQSQRYDAIIMNQLIEHLPDVHAFISEVLSLLTPNGELIVTTPNKSAYPDGTWETELPPVHLWWFGEEAMKCLAKRHNCTIAFVDFEPFYTTFYRRKIPGSPLLSRQSIFDADGKLSVSQCLRPVTPLQRIMEQSGFLALLRKIRSVMVTNDRWLGAQGPICAAVLRPIR
ncbi:bifunctional 2-polyprenyl-6-hydroxyphenol methylase/3-demethylubiquinol 3-O-methyltransferase UbiG [Geobacter sp. AOG1]|uniref:class I SAM-dependent methyltransferase n=1 Tax=Geobacter sp. AOG1 TaxID=1566346 RepID=UPI001CC59928|nr:methyltransferase domain-containing protein [Geobacter sp. AOG1]GFE58594.1 hypothetical protein AOG1_24740 [Geobacter sp. AOG1]